MLAVMDLVPTVITAAIDGAVKLQYAYSWRLVGCDVKPDCYCIWGDHGIGCAYQADGTGRRCSWKLGCVMERNFG